MAIIQSGVSGSTLMTVDPTFTAGRTSQRPIEQLGTYLYGGFTGLVTGVAANAPILSMRFVAGSAGSAQIALIQRITINYVMNTGFTASQQIAFAAFVARSFTASDSGGTQIVVSGNNQKARTSNQTSQIATNGDMRISSTGALTTGTRTLDSQAFAVSNSWAGTTVQSLGVQVPQQVILYECFTGDTPVVLQSNEGLIINNVVALGAAGVITIAINVEWTESNTASSTAY